LWQWKAQSPGLSAVNSMSRDVPTGTLTLFSGHHAVSGIGPASVPVT
jgi:hypothetical protein